MSVPPSSLADLLRPATSVDALLGVQHALAALAGAPRVEGALPLGRAMGRVLARPHGPAAAQALPAGLRLEPQHLALLVASRQSTATVFERPRVGVVALGDGPGAAASGPSAATAALLAGVVERLGAQAFQASCSAGCPNALVRSVRMLASACTLVLIAGVLDDPVAGALLQALGDPAGADPWPLTCVQVPGLASVQLARLGGTLALAVGSDPRAGAACSATLVAPLLRALQGRQALQPPVRHATLAGDEAAADDGDAPLLVQEAGEAAGGLQLRRCGTDVEPALVLAAADGVAWRPPATGAGPGATLAYFPFRTALA